MSDPLATSSITDNPDVQGLVFYPYKESDHAVYCLFRIVERTRFQGWLADLLARGAITPAQGDKRPDTQALNIAFSASGMKCLLDRGWIPESYDDPFVEGMVTSHRSRLLGDVEANDPDKWLWGSNPGNDPSRQIDGLLIAFGNDRDQAEARLDLTGTGAERVHDLIFGQMNPAGPRNSRDLKGKEPFGFDDGISQPVIVGSKRYNTKLTVRQRKLHGVPAGELLLGYEDGSGSLPRTPATASYTDKHQRLQPHWEWPDQRDLGRNGTYLVLRQLEQDVETFWDYLNQAVSVPGETANDLGAKLVGRHLNGKPLVPDANAAPDFNEFDFSDDPKGEYCPLGSHIRRSNPRSFGVEPAKAKGKLEVTNRHRILRRGRVYTGPDGKAEGLLFLCLNASIGRQFEFIQSTWCNNPFFGGMDREVDPLIGTLRATVDGRGLLDQFTIQRAPYRRVLNGLSQFVTVKGGAYFFMPALRALECMAHAP